VTGGTQAITGGTRVSTGSTQMITGGTRVSTGSTQMNSGKSYTQQNDNIISSDSGKSLTIPKGTTYTYKVGKQGASFKLGNSWGWFGCQSKTFQVENVKYRDQKGYLTNNIVKTICGA